MAEQDFDNLSNSEEDLLDNQLREIPIDIYKGLLISRAIRAQVERCSDREIELSKKALEDIGVKGLDYSKPAYVHPRHRESKKTNNRSS